MDVKSKKTKKMEKPTVKIAKRNRIETTKIRMYPGIWTSLMTICVFIRETLSEREIDGLIR